MAIKKLRQVNEVNGWKVNHPHSAANIFYSIFTFIFAAFPLLFLYVPLISSVPVTFEGGLSGLGIFKFFTEFLAIVFSGYFEPEAFAALAVSNPIVYGIITSVNPILQEAAFYMFVALGAMLLVFMVFSVVLLILSIVNFSKGYLRAPSAVKWISLVEFLLSILFFAVMLFFFFAFKAETKTDLFVWLTAIPLGASFFFFVFFSIFYFNAFKDTILEKDLEIQNDEATVEHISKVHEVTKYKYENSPTLPSFIPSIGGHAFAENQNLVVANIPDNITKLGASAFANCLNLQVVSIPRTIKEIGFNCFFNCASLERINYGGTKEEWRRIKRGSNWLTKAKTSEVLCLDGAIIVNPYH